MSDMKPTKTRELQSIRNDLNLLRKDLSELAQAVRTSLKQENRHVRQEAQQAFEVARERGDRVIHNVEHRIEERPFFSVFAAFAVGLLSGWLTERRALMGRRTWQG